MENVNTMTPVDLEDLKGVQQTIVQLHSKPGFRKGDPIIMPGLVSKAKILEMYPKTYLSCTYYLDFKKAGNFVITNLYKKKFAILNGRGLIVN